MALKALKKLALALSPELCNPSSDLTHISWERSQGLGAISSSAENKRFEVQQLAVHHQRYFTENSITSQRVVGSGPSFRRTSRWALPIANRHCEQQRQRAACMAR